MKVLFWFSILIITYIYFAFPIAIYLLSIFYAKPVRRRNAYPMVSIILSVYNEEENIENKIKSILSLNYPESRIEVLIGSDGSTDKTDVLIAEYVCDRTNFFRQNQRKGKPSILNLLSKKAKGDILVFTDARQRLDKNAVTELVKNFADEKVGCVSAELYFEGENTKSGSGMGLYWKYEKQIRKYESRIGSMMGVTGALYAIRRELFPDLPENLILDDVYVPMTVIQKGYRAIFDPKAKIYDRYSKSPKEEFARKTRTLGGNLQLIVYLNWLINPLKGLISWQFCSHKLLRLLVPFLLVCIFISNIFIIDKAFYMSLLILQIVFYCLALCGLLFNGKNRFFDVPYMFCLMNWSAVVGSYKFLTHDYDVLWEKTD